MKKYILLFLAIILFSCSKEKQHPFTYYYWKTNLRLDNKEAQALQKTTSPYLYTRFFDVDKIGNQFQPVGIITKDGSFTTNKKIVPTIFITNRTFLNIEKEDIEFLAKSITDLIEKKKSEYHLNTHNEIQIDCDWTAGTKEDYFQFLKELKKVSNKEITTTLRLHQVKDKKLMGIPPVDKVYLMCYSTSSPLENSTRNSILDTDLLKRYLANLEDYPVKKIDIALPIYSWGIITNHIGKHKLINALSMKDLNQQNLKKISDNEAEVLKDDFYFGHFLNKGFKIKVEEITPEQLQETTTFINKKIKDYTIIYYQLDSKFVNDKH